MKTYFLMIMACLLLNLNLFAGQLSPADQARLDAATAQYDQWQRNHPGLSLDEYSKRESDVAPCFHCPAPHALLSRVLPILKAMPNASQIQPIGELELQYAVEQLNLPEGIRCRDMIQTFDEHFEVRKFDGQLIQIAEGVFDKYSSIVQLTYTRPDLEQAIYYYRDRSNHIVQVIVDKKGKAKFRYYDYIPKDKIAIKKEESGKNRELPELASSEADLSVFAKKAEQVAPINTFATDTLSGHYSSSFHADVVPRGGVFKFIPKDVTLYDGNGEVGYGNAKVKGKLSSTLSKGHEVEFSVLTGEAGKQDAIVRYSATTSATGDFKEQKIVIPLNINIGSTIGVSGQIADMRKAGPEGRQQAMVMDFFEPAVTGEKARREYVTVSVIQTEGRPITYDLKRTFATNSSVYTASAGKSTTGSFLGVGYTPKNNVKGESVQVRFVNESGRLAGYATYSLASDILK